LFGTRGLVSAGGKFVSVGGGSYNEKPRAFLPDWTLPNGTAHRNRRLQLAPVTVTIPEILFMCPLLLRSRALALPALAWLVVLGAMTAWPVSVVAQDTADEKFEQAIAAGDSAAAEGTAGDGAAADGATDAAAAT